MNMHSRVERQLRRATLVGPFFAPEGQNDWFPTPLDGATHVPARFRLAGKAVPVKRVRFSGNLLDLEQHMGPLASLEANGRRKLLDYARWRMAVFGNVGLDIAGRRSLGYVMWQVETPVDGTLSVAYSGMCSAWWVDGREVYATRGNNGGPVPAFQHRFNVPLAKGSHVICLRGMSEHLDWKLYLPVLKWRAGIDDEARIDRAARWRNYGNSLVRIEERPRPTGTIQGIATETYEANLAMQGVDARWLSVVNDYGEPLFKSRHLPMARDASPDLEQRLKEWVQLLHARRVAVMSWYPLILNRVAWQRHPDWRQAYLVPPPPGSVHRKLTCCFNSPYGDALIKFVIEAIRKFDLDGFWFDGSSLSPIWHPSRPSVSCVCRHCRAKFRSATGLELPERYDWSREEFRRWVQWRYDTHAAYWQRLTDEVHKAEPHAGIVFNHYHREDIGWNTAVPLMPFGKGFVSGTEADWEPLRGAFYTRLMRAYGRADTEVWLPMGRGRQGMAHGKSAVFSPRPILDFAAACATAGGHCSVGGAELGVEGPTVGLLARELKPRAPYLNLPSIPHIALHVSQQTETFVFGRNPDFTRKVWHDYAWQSYTGWHHLLAFAGLTCDVVFDARLKAAALRKYPVLIMPMAVALTRAQFESVMAYVRAGGTLITGPWFALQDEWGEAGAGYPLGDRRLFPFGQTFPAWSDIEKRPDLAFTVPGFAAVKAHALADLAQIPRRVSLKLSAGNPAMRVSRCGRGRILQSAFDWGSLFRFSPARSVATAFRSLHEALDIEPPLVELAGDACDLILGVFRKDSRTVVAHVQHFPPPWETLAAQDMAPPPRGPVVLRWNGPRPESVFLALPGPGRYLGPVARDKAASLIAIPPFVRGQVVEIRHEKGAAG